MSKSLSGKTVLVTRASNQAAELTQLLQQKGATVIEAPAIEIVENPEKIEELKEALQNIQRYSWLILTSSNTVAILDRALKSSNRDWNTLRTVQIACIGSATAAAVEQHSGNVSLVPPSFQAESLAEKLSSGDIAGQHFLLPRAAGSRDVLPKTLEKNGAVVKEIHVYRTEQASGSREKLEKALSQEPLDFITFTSSSTVHNFFALAGDLADRINWSVTRAAVIGPITAATLREYQVSNYAQAREFTIEGLVKAIEEAAISEVSSKGQQDH